MEITGRIIAVLPVQGGISKNGNEWKKQEYVLETHDQYPKKYASRFRCRPHRPGSHTARRRTYSIFDIDSVNIRDVGSQISMHGKWNARWPPLPSRHREP